MTTAQLTAVCTLALSLSAAVAPATRAQTEGWLLGPGPKTGKESTIVPTNCVTAADGSITCDTKVENPASDTPARPYYNPQQLTPREQAPRIERVLSEHC